MIKTRDNADRPALVVSDLHKTFGEVHALAGMSWTASAGQITVVLGPNGAGKTTALRCIAGVLHADRGDITILGRAVSQPGARDGITFLPEQPELYPALTVFEHLRFIALAHRMGASWRTKADELLERFQLTALVDELPGELSQGQRRKAALVTALLYGAEVLLFDEPFNGLDPHATSELRGTLQELATRGATVVVSTHLLAAAERFVDRAVVVDRGTVRVEGTMAELRDTAGVSGDADLEAVFLSLTERPPERTAQSAVQAAKDPIGQDPAETE